MEKNEGCVALSKISAHDFSTRLFDFWNQSHRVLPWRSDPSPFHVWVSEIMLQQTRVDTVKGYYLRFVDALPSVKALADAPEDVYLKLWEGLGYYSRVRNLHRAALEIQNRFHGEIPSSYEELVSLPGIGDYTANAILACGRGWKFDSSIRSFVCIIYRPGEACGSQKSAKRISTMVRRGLRHI